VTAANVVDLTLDRAYREFPEAQRVDFLGVVAKAAWGALTAGDLGEPARLAQTLGAAARDRHLLVWFRDPAEERLADALGISGRLPPVRGDSLLVLDQNAAGNKTDFYLRRHVRYHVRLAPHGAMARVQGRLDVRLENDAPAAGLSPIVIGPYDARFLPGENRSYLSVYTPHAFTAATLDGAPAGMESERELGRQVYSRFLSLPAGGHHDVRLDLSGDVRLGRGGWYALDLVAQPLLRPDLVEVRVELPPGWRVAETVGLRRAGPRSAVGSVRLVRDTTVWVRVVTD
jgi:hypothetical protein